MTNEQLYKEALENIATNASIPDENMKAQIEFIRKIAEQALNPKPVTIKEK